MSGTNDQEDAEGYGGRRGGEPASVTAIGRGTFLVEHHDTRTTVYVAGPPNDRWAFWNGHVFRSAGETAQPAGGSTVSRAGGHTLTAPMPATVIKVLVAPGATVSQGTTLVLLEAMKMELPIRALETGTVKAVYCHEGDLVQADQRLVEVTGVRGTSNPEPRTRN